MRIRNAEAVLALWREVERELESARQGSERAEFLQAEAVRLRDEYQAVIETVRERETDPEMPNIGGATTASAERSFPGG